MFDGFLLSLFDQFTTDPAFLTTTRDRNKFNSEVRVRCIKYLKELVELKLAFFSLTLTVHS